MGREHGASSTLAPGPPLLLTSQWRRWPAELSSDRLSSSTPPGDGAGLETHLVSLLLLARGSPAESWALCLSPWGAKGTAVTQGPPMGPCCCPSPTSAEVGAVVSPLLSYHNSCTLLGCKMLAKAFNGIGRRDQRRVIGPGIQLYAATALQN